MGNGQSDRGESAAYNVIKHVPIVGQGYGLVRAAVYAAKDDPQRFAASMTGTCIAPFAPGVADHMDRTFTEDGGGVWKSPSELLNGSSTIGIPFPGVNIPVERAGIRPVPGDLIEFDRGTHAHYGLYLGDDKVMHVYTGSQDDEEEELRSMSKRGVALIEEKTIWDVCTWLKTDRVRIRRMHDQVALDNFGASPQSQDSIIAAARRMEGREVPYQLTIRNCEYYVTLWRYGVGFSTQVARPTSTPLGVFIPSPLGLVSAPLGLAELGVYEQYRLLAHCHSIHPEFS